MTLYNLAGSVGLAIPQILSVGYIRAWMGAQQKTRSGKLTEPLPPLLVDLGFCLRKERAQVTEVRLICCPVRRISGSCRRDRRHGIPYIDSGRIWIRTLHLLVSPTRCGGGGRIAVLAIRRVRRLAGVAVARIVLASIVRDPVSATRLAVVGFVLKLGPPSAGFLDAGRASPRAAFLRTHTVLAGPFMIFLQFWRLFMLGTPSVGGLLGPSHGSGSAVTVDGFMVPSVASPPVNPAKSIDTHCRDLHPSSLGMGEG